MADGDTQTEQPAAPQFPLPPLNMSWAKVPTERPPKPTIGAEGFTLRIADHGSYGWVPDHWPYENDTPRGSWPSKDMGLPAPYSVYDKAECWADNAAELYESAIREQWKPATQISWNTIEPLPDHVEAAYDQILSNFSEQTYNSVQVLSGWLKEISYGFHEVKLYLATQTFDHARHVEAFRKRALANGGGLGVQTPGFFNRTVYAAFKFTELVIYMNIIRTSFLLALCERADTLGRSQADRQLFDLTAKDLRRHLAYGVEHLRYYLLSGDEQRRRNVRTWLERGEIMMAADLKRDVALREAFILALGDTVQKGKEGLKELRQAQLKLYLRSLESATFPGHEQYVAGPLKELTENP
jgi:hypothetical protein